MERERWRIRVQGIVQGVGFRPFIFRLAADYALTGWVRNDNEGVLIEAEGEPLILQQFLSDIEKNAPSAAKIGGLNKFTVPVKWDKSFVIACSGKSMEKDTLVSPDIAICPSCRREILDSNDCRYGYPFTNCTDCGPRYTIIEEAPYDRERTSMRTFIQCSHCQKEYDNPLDRRFHAQPNACPNCGPQLTFCGSASSNIKNIKGGSCLEMSRKIIQQGKILAIKGIGGFHLAVDAMNESAVSRLRQRKHREKKPFAVMAGSLERIKEFAEVSQTEEQLLTSAVAPIVLLRKKNDAFVVAPSVAPDNAFIGVMLPYAPVQVLLLKPDDVWVMTSGNPSGEPQLAGNDEAEEKLGKIADAFLIHNREIVNRIDDSVMRQSDTRQVLRRGRGLAPAPLPVGDGVDVLAGGAELKSSFCYVHRGQAFLSEHLGDLKNKSVYDEYRRKIARYQQLFSLQPMLLVSDYHPDYLSSRYMKELAEKNNLPLIKVQHHKAHIASVLAEHNEEGPVIGVAFDGTGYGEDGCSWGGEFFVGPITAMKRQAHFRYLPLPGGDKAAEEPWRQALWVLHGLFGEKLAVCRPDFAGYYSAGGKLLLSAVEKGVNSPLSSGVGRLFDTAAALLGITYVNTYEGEAACALEQAALMADSSAVLPYETVEKDGMIEIDFLPVLQAMARKYYSIQKSIDSVENECFIKQKNNCAVAELAMSFHQTVADAAAATVKQLIKRTGIKKIAISGGVFQNLLLTELLMKKLSDFKILKNEQVPPNDGGIAYGQAAIAMRLKRG